MRFRALLPEVWFLNKYIGRPVRSGHTSANGGDDGDELQWCLHKIS
jgi:hypothetical protein